MRYEVLRYVFLAPLCDSCLLVVFFLVMHISTSPCRHHSMCLQVGKVGM